MAPRSKNETLHTEHWSDMKTKENKKILIVYNHDSSWIKDDIEMLRRHYGVETFFYRYDKKRKKLSSLIKNCDVVYIWFASYHGLKAARLGKRYKKKVITVASGYSVANVPEQNYGLASKFYTRWIPKYIIKNSDATMAVSEANKKEISLLMKSDVDIVTIPHGFNKDRYELDKKIEREKMVITVGGLDMISFKRKGVDKYMNIAKYFPDIPFVAIGKINDDVRGEIKNAPSNVEFTGFVSDQELLGFYQRAKAYAQFSFHEAFGCSVAEAMLCGCVPVVTRTASLPEVVGDRGFYVPYWDEGAAVEAVDKALNASEELGEKARDRIAGKFSLGKREEKLVELIEETVRRI